MRLSQMENLNGNRRKSEHPAQASGAFKIASAQRSANVIQLQRVFQRQIERPAFLGIQQIDIDFGNISSFMDQFG